MVLFSTGDDDDMAHEVLLFAAAATHHSRPATSNVPAGDRELLQQLINDLQALIVERPIVIRVCARLVRQARQHTASSSSTG